MISGSGSIDRGLRGRMGGHLQFMEDPVARRRQQKASIPRVNDPLGFGLKSIPGPLQRLWLLYRGNPYFEAEAIRVRKSLLIPPAGFVDAASYVDWLMGRWQRHNHVDPLPVYLLVNGEPLRDGEAMTRHLSEGVGWPMLDPVPRACCSSDPLHEAARRLTHQFAVDQAEAEPGFEGVEKDIATYLLSNRWPSRRSQRGRSTIYETDVLVDAKTGRRVRERFLREDIGLESRAGKGGMLPLWYGWWKLNQAGWVLEKIESWTEEQHGTDAWYDERSIKHGIGEVERLMTPAKI